MSETSFRTHPLIIIAATTVILTCLLAIAIMTGVLPSPLAKDRTVVVENTDAPAPAKRPALADTRPVAPTPAPATRLAPAERAAPAPTTRLAPAERAAPAERPPVGATSGAAPARSAAGGQPAPRVAAVCTNCGTVTSVRAVKQQGEAGMIGPAAGTAIGGLIGSQIGDGSGKAIATIAGAAGGAALGTELERRYKSTTHYVVGVRLNDGTTRSFTYGTSPGFDAGDKVRIVNGRLVRDS